MTSEESTGQESSHPTLWSEDFHASQSVSPDGAKGKKTSGGSGPNSYGAFAFLDPSSSLWRTFQESFYLGWTTKEDGTPRLSKKSLLTWPRSILMLKGVVYQQPPWVRLISGGVSFLWPTPRVIDSTHRGTPNRMIVTLASEVNRIWPTPAAAQFDGTDPAKWMARRQRIQQERGKGHNGFGLTLGQAVIEQQLRWPTPTARDHKDTGDLSKVETNHLLPRVEHSDLGAVAAKWSTPLASNADRRGTQPPEKRRGGEHTVGLNDQVGGQLNPDWVEMLMGFPPGWTDLS